MAVVLVPAVGMRVLVVIWEGMIGIIDPICPLSVYQYIDFRGRDAAAIHTADVQFSADIERSQGSTQ